MKKLLITFLLLMMPFYVQAAEYKMTWGYTPNEVKSLFSHYGYTPDEKDITWWGSNRWNTWGNLEDNLIRRAKQGVEDLFGATIPIAGSTYNLAGSGVTGSATSITLSSLTITQTGQKLYDADFSDTFYLTLEPGNRTRQEIASCTTVAQNANGTATLSGCARGLSPIYPYTASSTLQFSHAGGSQVIFSDPPQLFNLYPAKANTESISGTWTFADSPLLTTDCTVASANNEICAKAYIDGVVVSGSSDANETTKGISELATNAEAAAGTSLGSTGARLVLPSSIATSSSDGTSYYANKVIVSESDGKLDQDWFDLANEGWGFASTTATNATTTRLNVGTGNYTGPGKSAFYVGGNATTTGSLSVGELCFGSTNCRSGGDNYLLFATSTDNTFSATASSTIMSFTVGGNQLIGTNAIVGKITFSHATAAGGRSLTLCIKADSTYLACNEIGGGTLTAGTNGFIDVVIGAKNSSALQVSSLTEVYTDTTVKTWGGFAESSVDMTSARTISIEGKWSGSNTGLRYQNASFDLKR